MSPFDSLRFRSLAIKQALKPWDTTESEAPSATSGLTSHQSQHLSTTCTGYGSQQFTIHGTDAFWPGMATQLMLLGMLGKVDGMLAGLQSLFACEDMSTSLVCFFCCGCAV